MLAAMGLFVAGCGEDIGPSPGVVDGQDTIRGQANSLVPFEVEASGRTYEAFALYVDTRLAAWIKGRPPLGGVLQGTGSVAPLEGYQDIVEAAAGYSYFFLTSDGDHYGKLEVLELVQEYQARTVDMSFHWWLQTREGDPDIGG